MAPESVSLTRVEARERASLIRGCAYRLELDCARGGERYGFSVTIEFDGVPGARTFVDAEVDRIDLVRWQGRELGSESVVNQRIALPPLEGHNRLEVLGSSRYHRTGLGLHLAIDPADGERYLYSDLEPAEAHRVFPCFDQPDIKGPFDLKVLVPQDWTVISAEPGRAGAAPDQEGARWWSFPTTRPLAPYVLGIAAGRLHAVRDRHGDTPLGLFAPLSLSQDLEKAAPEILEVTKAGLSYYEQLFGIPYPFAKYDQAFCLEKVNGAMESPGCVTITDRMIFRGRPSGRESSQRAEVILHEMAHMWFGDLVTMRWWDDLWLNESFATFMAAMAQDRATPYRDAWTYWATLFKQLAVDEDQHSTSHPVVTEVPDAEAVNLNFDRITYQKGAAVLRQLAAWVGEDAFFAAIREHLHRHQDGNAEYSDLVGALTEASGRDVAGWSRAWLHTTGINTLRCEVESDGESEGSTLGMVRILQTAAPRQPVLRPHHIALGRYDWRDGGLERSSRLEVDLAAAATTEVGSLRNTPRPALLLPNDGALSYAKIRLDSHSQATMVHHLGAVRDPLARAVLWDSSWDMVRDAELPASRFVRMVTAHLPTETDQSLVPVVLSGARSALSRYAAAERGDQLEAALAEAAASTLEATEPGSLEQLSWLRAFVSSAVTPEQLARCRAMLSGKSLPEGVALDLEMRWRLVTALAARGAAEEEDLATMQRADPTTTGGVRALGARGAMPSWQAKEEVFRRLTEDPAATVEETIWVGRSFAGIRRDDLVIPFVPRFFAAVDRLEQTRGHQYTRDFAYWFMPSLPPCRELVDGVRDQLARPDLRADLRRVYIDALEEAERALIARELDRATEDGPLD